MPKRQQTEGDGSRKPRRKPMRRKQLYLVLDDWEKGSSIRKIDDPDNVCRYGGLRRLPRPIYQLEAVHGFATSLATSLGPKVMIANSQHTGAQCFDTRSSYILYGSRPHGVSNRPTFIPFGDNKLCALWGRSLQLCAHETRSWSWCKIQDLPFDESNVNSYAVHPDGQRILVSVEQKRYAWSNPTSETTYSFNIYGGLRSDAFENCIEGWSLPFRGRGYYVDEFKAWVGLSKSYYDTNGHLCYCPLVETVNELRRVSCKIGKESLFSKSQVESHEGATLVYMGNKEFCLVECIRVNHGYLCQGDPLNPPPFDFLLPYKDKFYHPLLKLTMFSLAVEENGDLTTGNKRFQYYSIPGSVSRSSIQCPVVFLL